MEPPEPGAPRGCEWLVDDLEVFAGFEADGFAGGDGDFGSGAGIAADAGFAGLDGEDAEAAELDAIAFDHGLLHGVEDGVDGGFRFGADDAGALDDTLDEILFDQLSPRGVRCVIWDGVVRVGNFGSGRAFLTPSLRCDGRKGVAECQWFPRDEDGAMSIKSDRWIREQALEHGMIAPFSEKQVKDGVISYGLSSYGYDLRVSDEFKIFTNVNSAIIDPKAFDERSFVTVEAASVIVPPNSFALARSIEYFKIPRDVLTICVGKSTYARCGIIVNVTPFEPEWEGYVTLEISNTTPLPARIYANEGLCQILFFQSDEVCEVSYADRKGKYQNQQGIVLPKL